MAGQREPRFFTGFTDHSERALPAARTGGRFQRPDHPGIQAAVCDARPSKRSGHQQVAIFGYRTLVTLSHGGICVPMREPPLGSPGSNLLPPACRVQNVMICMQLGAASRPLLQG